MLRFLKEVTFESMGEPRAEAGSPPSIPTRSRPCRAGLPRARVRPLWECARWADGGIGEGAGNRLCTA